MKYRVEADRWDTPKKTVGEFTASSDEVARRKFGSSAFVANPLYALDHLVLLRITRNQKEIQIAAARSD